MRHARAAVAAPVTRTDYYLLRAECALSRAALLAAGLWAATTIPPTF